jgi:hypothetical protein
MNCLTARQMLELVRRDEPVADDFGAVDEASRHVETCPACQTAVRRQNQFDAKVGAMVRDVPVPADLKGRLLARLHAEAPIPVGAPAEIGQSTGSTTAVTTENSASPEISTSAPALDSRPIRSRGSRRRRWILAGALTAACIVTGIGAWSLWQAPSINPNEIAAELVKDDFRPNQLPELTKFANGLDVRLPATLNTRRLDLALPVRRLHTLDVAVYLFTVHGKGNTMLEGRLAVIPKRDVDPRHLPLAGPTPTEYKGGYCVTSWVEGEFVYVLCLKGASNELDRLVPPNRGAA